MKSRKKTKTKEKIIWASVGAAMMLVVAGIFWLGTQLYNQAKPAEESPAYKGKSLPAANANKNKNPDSETSWKTFENKFQGYEFSYPATGSVTQLGVSGHKKDVDPTDGACTTIHIKGGSITILGRVNNPDIIKMCLRTGVGAGWSKAPDLDVELFGQQLTASGMKTSSASAGYRKEFYHLNLATGEAMEISIEVNEKYTPETSYNAAKEEILQVLKTLQYLDK